MSGKRKQYDRAFKLSAVKLLESSEKSLEQVARGLGISGSMLRRWRNQVRDRGVQAISQKGRMERTELVRLKRENRELRRDMEALKKMLDYLDRAGRKGTRP
jgi:transposase